jgi:hypothetical protein
MKIDRRIIYGALLVAALLASCGTSNQLTTPARSPTPLIVMTSPSMAPPGTAYPAPEGYPAPDSPTATAYPAPTGTP